MRKKVFVVFLAAVMALCMLAGCRNQKEQQDSRVSSKTDESKSKEVTETGKEEPVTVTWLVAMEEPKDSGQVMDDLNQKLVEAINVKLNIEWISDGEYDDRTKLASTSGEDYDIVFTSNWRNSFDDNMARNAFLEISGLIDQYGQNIVAGLQPEFWDVATVRGGIYAIPNQQIAASQIGFYVQKDLADKYNFTLTHTTTDDWKDLEPFLDAVLANEKNMYGMNVRQGPGKSLYEALINGMIGIRRDDDPSDGVEVIWEMNESWYDYSYLMEKGYLHPEWATGGDMNVPNANNQFAVIVATGYPYGDVAVSNTQGEEYMMCLKGEPYFGMAAGKETMLAVNVNSKNPEAAIKLLNEFWGSEELFNELLFGLEGIHYNKTGEQRVEVIEGSDWDVWKEDWAMGNQFLRWKVPGEEDDAWDLISEQNRTSKVSPLRGFNLDTTGLQTEIAQVRAVMAEYDRFYARDGWEDLIAERREKMISAGIETIVAEAQRQVDEYLANIK